MPRSRVLIKLAGTWEGIRCAEALERDGIKTNITLVGGVGVGKCGTPLFVWESVKGVERYGALQRGGVKGRGGVERGEGRGVT